jgi:hypothetical protein
MTTRGANQAPGGRREARRGVPCSEVSTPYWPGRCLDRGRRSDHGSIVFRICRMKSSSPSHTQPAPHNPGVSKQRVRQHARWLFRDQWEHRPLTTREWRLAERDLVRRLEAEAL